MEFKAASLPSVVSFLLIVLSIFIMFFCGSVVVFKRSGHPAPKKVILKILLGIFAMLAVLGSLVGSGWVETSPMPRLLVLFGSINLLAVGLAFSPLGKLLATHLSFGSLVLFQAFRFPLELVLHSWALQGTIPETMTWTGQNFDIISGVLALVCFWFADRSRLATWIFGIVGFGLLLNVMRVVVFSSPLPFAWQLTPPLLLAFHLPYALIGPVCVGGAIAGHLILFRKLLN